MTASLCISDQLKEWLDEEIEKQQFAEDFRFDIRWSLVPTPQGKMMAHEVAITLRHPLPGSPPLVAPLVVAGTQVTQEAVSEAAAQAMAALRVRSRTILRQLRGGPKPPAMRGPAQLG